MTMKQTQTKMFDFADVGLDFCSGSKNLFPDRFKKMLSQGYNEQTVASVSVTGNQVTLNYGVAHGYVADRVLKINSGPLAAIKGGEFWIDAVTATSVTMTIDAAPTSIAGGFTTKIAPLGWQLVYEQANIQVYKLKQLDGSDIFIRLCFQNNAAYRNRVSPCVGRSFNPSTGEITDEASLAETKNIANPSTFAWEFSLAANSAYDNHTYTQGYNIFGRALVVGSKYHFVALCSTWVGSTARVNALIPYQSLDYSVIKLPLFLGESTTPTGNGQSNQIANLKLYAGKFETKIQASSTTQFAPTYAATQSFLPTSIDEFNTTTASPVMIYEKNSGQFLGITTGFYYTHYGTSTVDVPSSDNKAMPLQTTDVDLSSICFVHCITSGASNVFFAVPVEEIKIA